MNVPPEEKWEMQVLRAARAFPYPETPDIAGATRDALRGRHRLRRVWLRAIAAIVLVLLASILFVPEIRAGVLEVLRIGAVRIFFGHSEAPTVIPSLPPSERSETNSLTIADAERLLGTAIQLPAYPPDLGMPDTISVVDGNFAVITLVWHSENTRAARLVLQIIEDGVEVVKYGLPYAHQVTVNGEYAVWLETPHLVEMNDSSGNEIPYQSWLIQSHVLVWAESGITYRLETALPRSEALAIAESLRPASEQ